MSSIKHMIRDGNIMDTHEKHNFKIKTSLKFSNPNHY